MMLSPVIGRAAWRATLTVPSAEALAEVQAIPGVSAWENPVSVPYSAIPAVVSVCQTYGAGLAWLPEPEVHVPRPWGPEHAEELIDRLLGGGIKPGALFGGGVLPNDAIIAEFQMGAVWFGLEHGSCLLKEAPGAGKTIQALSLGLATCGDLPLLIVTPSSVIRQYARQVDRLTTTQALELRAPSEAPVRKGTRMTAVEQIDEYLAARRKHHRPAVVIVGWDSLTLHLQAILSRAWGAVVWDEAQLGKTGKRQVWARDATGNLRAAWTRHRASAAAQIAQHVRHRFATTATPIFDRRPDLWGVATLVDPFGWGKTPKRFLTRYCGGHQGEHGFVANEALNDEELQARLATIFHVVPKKISHAQLPPTRITTRFIRQEDLDAEPAGFGRQVVLLGRQAKQGSLEAHAQLRELLLMATAARKRSAVLEDVQSFLASDDRGKGKVLLFTGRHEDCWDLAERFKKAQPGLTVFCGVVRSEPVAEGGRPTYALPNDRARDALHQEYMNHPGPCVFVATGGAWGTGLDLQDTDLLGVVMLPPNPGPFIQWLGRVERLGQTRACEIRIYIGEGTADTTMASAFGEKSEDLVRLFDDKELEGIKLKLQGVDDMGQALDRLLIECRKAWVADENADWSEWDEQGVASGTGPV